jgi:hypothetical protein
MDKEIVSIVNRVYNKIISNVSELSYLDKNELINYVLSKKKNYNGNNDFRIYFSLVTRKAIIVLLDKHKDRIKRVEMRDYKLNQILNG